MAQINITISDAELENVLKALKRKISIDQNKLTGTTANQIEVILKEYIRVSLYEYERTAAINSIALKNDLTLFS